MSNDTPKSGNASADSDVAAELIDDWYRLADAISNVSGDEEPEDYRDWLAKSHPEEYERGVQNLVKSSKLHTPEYSELTPEQRRRRANWEE